MNRIIRNQRNIKFFSDKNKAAFVVCSERMKHYASLLEDDRRVTAYRVHEAFDMSALPSVDSIDIRAEYLDADASAWATDFWIEFDNGTYAIRELVDIASLRRRADLEKLELSRRYWASRHIEDWKVVILVKTEKVKEEREDEYVF